MSVCPAALDATVISEILEVLTALKVDREPVSYTHLTLPTILLV